MKFDLLKKVFNIDFDADMRSMKVDQIDNLIVKIVDAQNNLLNGAEKEARDLTNDEAEGFDLADELLKKLQIELTRRVESKQQRAISIGFGGAKEPAMRSFGINLQWRELFPGYRGNGQKPDDFLKDVIEKRAMISSSGPSGGYTVPDELWSDIYRYALMESIALQRVRVFPMQSGSLTIPALDSEDRSDGTTDGGLEVDWVSEGGTFTKRTPKLRAMTLTAKKAGVYVDISRECLADSASLSNTLTPLMSRAVRQALDIAIISGSGVGRPQGILNSPAAITVTRNTASSVVYTDLANMVARLLPGSNPVWLCNPEVYPELLKMVDAASNYIWIPNHAAGAGVAIPDNVLGFPLIRTDFCPGLGSEGDLVLVDFSYYGLGMRQDIPIESTIAAAWTEDLTSFRCILRADGQLLLGNAVSPMNGSARLSPVVILQ